MELINNVKNKSFIILSIVLVLFFFVSSSVFADTVSYPVFNSDEEISAPVINESYGVIVIQNRWGVYYHVFNDSNGFAYIDSNGYLGFSGSHNTYELKNNTWNLMGTNQSRVSSTDNVNGDNNCKMYFGITVYSDVNKSSIYYSPLSVEIPAVESVEQIPQTMVKVLRVLIPVGLVGCGIFLVVLLMRRVLLRLS